MKQLFEYSLFMVLACFMLFLSIMLSMCGGQYAAPDAGCPAGEVCCATGGHCKVGQTCNEQWCVDDGFVECTNSSGTPNGTECPSGRGCCLLGCCL